MTASPTLMGILEATGLADTGLDAAVNVSLVGLLFIGRALYLLVSRAWKQQADTTTELEELDCRAEDAEDGHKTARQKNTSRGDSDDLKAEAGRRVPLSAETMAIHHEVEAASHNIADMKSQPFLEASKRADDAYKILSAPSLGKLMNASSEMSLPQRKNEAKAAVANPDSNGVGWENVTITLLKGYKIRCAISERQRPPVMLSEIGLLDRRTSEPNAQYKALSDIANGSVFGGGERVSNKVRACKSKLKRGLRELTDLPGEPFQRHHPELGYKPLFSLVDRRGDADERAKRQAIETEYKDTDGYSQEDDPAGLWLANQENGCNQVNDKKQSDHG